jgi:LuxR family maltose regulon positive regulatory protein
VSTGLAVRTPATRPVAADDPLLASKFAIPELPRFLVPRPRLLKQLSSGLANPVTVVTGPAGSGKTHLLASWARDAAVRDHVVWITFEDEDSSARMFWTYVVEGLRRTGLSLPSLVPPTRATVGDRSFLVRLAADLQDQPESVILILDGVSSLADHQWAADLEFVVRHTAQQLRLVLAGRWDPPLPLHRYRLAGRLTRVQSEDLAFTRQEAASLLALHYVTLSPSALASLMEQTEGWTAGLRLFALALQGHGDPENLLATLTGDEADIAEYFASEVLHAQPQHVRSFLMATSILDTFTPELAQALTGRADAHRLLAELKRTNGFIQPTDERSTIYRYHRLFGELLRAQLTHEEPDRLPQLHRQASNWFTAQGQFLEALRHAVKAGDWGSAAAAVVDHYAVGWLLVENGTGRLNELLRDLPDDIDCPEAATVTAALAIAAGCPDRCAEFLIRAGDLAANRRRADGGALAVTTLLLEVRLGDAYRDAARVLHSAAAAESLLAQAPPEAVGAHPELRLLVLAAKGAAQSHAGEIDAAAATFAEATAHAPPGCEHLKADCLQQLALIEAYRGRLTEAESRAREASELASRCGSGSGRRSAGAEVALAWVAVERYDVESAGRHLRAVNLRDGREINGTVAAGYAIVKSRRLQVRGELSGAMAALRQAEASAARQPHPAWLGREITLARARLLMMTGHPDAALATVRELDPGSGDAAVVQAAALLASGERERAARIVAPLAEAEGIPTPVAVDAWLVLATMAAHGGNLRQARDALRQALQLATPEGQRRAVNQVWAQLRRVIRADDDLLELYRALSGNAGRLPRRPSKAGSSAYDVVIIEPLSKREMDVLRGMAAMLTTEEMAASMYVSVNTVKTHIRSILRKLSASRRNEAVRRARSLELL